MSFTKETKRERSIDALQLNKIVKRVDTFGQQLPAFNIKGDKEVKTICGGIITILVYLTLFLWAAERLVEVINKENLTVTEFSEYLDIDEKINFNEINFKFAFTFEDILSEE